MNSKVLFRTVRYKARSEQIQPVMIHVNYHPDKHNVSLPAYCHELHCMLSEAPKPCLPDAKNQIALLHAGSRQELSHCLTGSLTASCVLALHASQSVALPAAHAGHREILHRWR